MPDESLKRINLKDSDNEWRKLRTNYLQGKRKFKSRIDFLETFMITGGTQISGLI
jgi:hypothetical protein